MLRRLAARDPERYPLLLDSAAEGPLSQRSRLLAAPSAALWLDRTGRLGAQGLTPQGEGFLAALENWWRSERLSGTDGEGTEPLSAGGWAIFLGYELAGEIEPHLALPRTPLPWQAFALRTHGAIELDLRTGRIRAAAEDSRTLARLLADALQAAAEADRSDSLTIARVREEDPRA
ncbi:MAG: hypothetical protein JOY74_07145, partial [Sinobacteraceae bacterium]|nr:hypothetical protein [Nevskiaceae bacterium]